MALSILTAEPTEALITNLVRRQIRVLSTPDFARSTDPARLVESGTEEASRWRASPALSGRSPVGPRLLSPSPRLLRRNPPRPPKAATRRTRKAARWKARIATVMPTVVSNEVFRPASRPASTRAHQPLPLSLLWLLPPKRARALRLLSFL